MQRPTRRSNYQLDEMYVDLGGGVTLDMVYLEGDSFEMGSAYDEFHGNPPPRRLVEVAGFWIGRYEVTQEQYETIMNETPSEFHGATHPVENVSWEDAVEFCERLSDREGRTYRLPTEAQWEYACRAGTQTRYHWGDDDSPNVMKDYCWYEENANASSWTTPHAPQEGTQPVGLKGANDWGLYDMRGNVREWCAAGQEFAYFPTGPTSGADRVNRGGSWARASEYCRSASPFANSPERRNDDLGFRVVLQPQE